MKNLEAFMSNNDMSSVIVPRSDQTNSDDLVSGPRTITITGVDIRPGTEQPVSVNYQGDNDRPWKPCKTQCRVLVALWGPDASAYTGRSLTLYTDPKVKWGGVEVGGIRISHASHIDADRTLSLTVTKGQRKPFVVRRLETVTLGSVLDLIQNAKTLDDLTAAASKAGALLAGDKANARAAYAARKANIAEPKTGKTECVGHDRGGTSQCCERAGEYNGYGSDGPTTFTCPTSCSCHD